MKNMWRFGLGLLALLVAGNSTAQTNYPEKPIRIVVGFPPGGTVDTVGRLLAQKLTETLAKPVVVENVSGASGNIATERVAKAAPDGYTLTLMGEGQVVVNPSLYKLPYDQVRDFAPVSQVMVQAYLLVVNNAVPARSVKELDALAKAQPGALTFASNGNGGGPHMAAELFKSVAGIDIRHIPYKGGALAIPDLLGARVTMMFASPSSVLPMVRDGKLRALAVTSLKRSSAAPGLPTIAESGYPGFEVTNWNGLLAPGKTPAAIIRKLHLEIVKVLALPDMRARLVDLGMEAIGNAPDEFAATINRDIAKWAKLIRDSGIRAD
jgi:tripartite-type tricarboxylate transporter receptor subunit TctC